MRSKLHLKIDLIGQVILFLTFLGYSVYSIIALHPGSIFIWFMLLLLGLGFWQFTNGVIAATAFKSSIYGKYVAASVFYFGLLLSVSFVCTPIITGRSGFASWHGLAEIFYYFMLIIPPTGFAIWYSRRVWLDLKNYVPRSFWDY